MEQPGSCTGSINREASFKCRKISPVEENPAGDRLFDVGVLALNANYPANSCEAIIISIVITFCDEKIEFRIEENKIQFREVCVFANVCLGMSGFAIIKY